jgi:hypothetical protein
MLLNYSNIKRCLSANPRAVPWIVAAVGGYIFLAPNVSISWDLHWHDSQRIGQLVMLSIVCLVVFLRPNSARLLMDIWENLGRWIRAAIVSAFALGLVSSVMAPLPRWALLDWGVSWLLLMVTFGVAAQRRELGDRLDHSLVLLFFATATAYAVTSCTVYLTMLVVGPFFNVRELFTGFSNVRFFGHVATMLLPFLLLPSMWWGTNFSRRALLWIVPVIWWTLAIASGTRGTWIALLVGTLVVSVFCGRMGWTWIMWQIKGLVYGLICYGVFIWAIPKGLAQPTWFIHRTEDIVSLSMRDLLWTKAIEFAAQAPLLGIGPMHFAYFGRDVAAHPHSAVLQWAAEWGVPVALMLTGICISAGWAFVCYVRRNRETALERKAVLRVALLAALAGASAQAMVDGILVMPVSQSLLSLLCGWAVGMHIADRGVLPTALIKGRMLLVVTAGAVVAVACGIAPEIGRLEEREQSYLQAHPQLDMALPRLLPRFWTHGWIED